MRASFIELLRRRPAAYRAAQRSYRLAESLRRELGSLLPGRYRLRTEGQGNRVTRGKELALRRTTVRIVGDDNLVVFVDGARFDVCEIVIRGHHNRVELGASSFWDLGINICGNDNEVSVLDSCVARGLGLVCEDDGNSIAIGSATEVAGATELAAMEGTRISVGARCLFSGGVHVRTGDSHSLVDLSGRRINASKDVEIGDHVWVGTKVTMLKGSAIASDSVVAACSLVTKRFDAPNCVVGGSPAKVIREGVDWLVERIPVTNQDA
jgi:acetyltransferase-like isoleucine patch superfamily enzyme